MEMSRFQFSLLIILGLVKTFSLSLYWGSGRFGKIVVLRLTVHNFSTFTPFS